MSIINLGIIGGGQLGSMLCTAAKKLSINTTVYCDDPDAPAQNFCVGSEFPKPSSQFSCDQTGQCTDKFDV